MRQLASFGFSEGLNEISRDNGKRRIFVEINVRGRDIASFVAEAQSAIARDVRVPPGSWLEWGGQFKNLQQAIRRLEFVVPVCMALILGALYMALGNLSLALTVFTAVPLALAGGVFAIALRGIPFSISAAVGFIAVSGVAVLNGLVLDGRHSQPIGAGRGQPRCDLQWRARTAATGPDHSAGGLPWFCADGGGDRRRIRGAETACDRGDWWPDYVDGADIVPAPRGLWHSDATPRSAADVA